MAMQVNYLSAGSLSLNGIPPTVQQATKCSTVNVGLNPTNSNDNSQLLTNAFGLTTQQLSQGWPEVYFEPLDSLASGSGWYVLSKASNYIIAGRTATTASLDTTGNTQVICRMDRIWSGSK